jgi:hypothetical protein
MILYVINQLDNFLDSFCSYILAGLIWLIGNLIELSIKGGK